MGEQLVVAWPGSGLDGGGPTRNALELLAAARAAGGEGPIAFLSLDGLGDAGTGAYLEMLARAVAERRPETVLLASDARGRELGPRLAARTGGTAITDVVGVASSNGRTVWSRPCFGGKAVAQMVARRTPVVVTVRPRCFDPTPDQAGAQRVDPTPAAPAPDSVVSEEVRARDESASRLEDARVIVAGGRGVGGKDEFERLGELALLLGGVVGASLAAVDEGWASAEQQVGLTGKVVSPDLYLAVGISGASQHVAGLAGVKTVVAINSDASAPIFQVANLGAVLDAREAIPALIGELRSRGV